MTYRRDRGVREMYEDRFLPERQGPYPRAAGRVERRGPYTRPEEDYGRSGYDYEGGPRFFPNRGGPRNYLADDRGYHGDSLHYPAERRAGPHSRREDYPYSSPRVPREDPLSGRAIEFGTRAPPHSVRSQGIYPAARSLPESGEDPLVQAILNLDRGDERDHYRRNAAPFLPLRERPPARRDVAHSPHSRSGSSVSSRGYSPDRAKNLPFPSAQNKNKIPGLSREGFPHSASPNKDERHPPEAAKEELPLPVVAVKQEESQKSTESFQERRAMAIVAKAQEIEKVYRQDCETFGMVLNRLVAKDPNLEKQLQVPLRENLGDIRERCLEDLKQFINELDEVVRQPGRLACDSTTPTSLTSLKLSKTGVSRSSF